MNNKINHYQPDIVPAHQPEGASFIQRETLKRMEIMDLAELLKSWPEALNLKDFYDYVREFRVLVNSISSHRVMNVRCEYKGRFYTLSKVLDIFASIAKECLDIAIANHDFQIKLTTTGRELMNFLAQTLKERLLELED